MQITYKNRKDLIGKTITVELEEETECLVIDVKAGPLLTDIFEPKKAKVGSIEKTIKLKLQPVGGGKVFWSEPVRCQP